MRRQLRLQITWSLVIKSCHKPSKGIAVAERFFCSFYLFSHFQFSFLIGIVDRILIEHVIRKYTGAGAYQLNLIREFEIAIVSVLTQEHSSYQTKDIKNKYIHFYTIVYFL